MTLEEKIGQLFIAYFDGEAANKNAERLIVDLKIGGIIYYQFSNKLSYPAQIQTMSRGLQELARETTGIPLLIAIDQEGGLVSRLQEGFTVFPGNAALGRIGRPDLAYRAAKAMGSEMAAVGINLNFAPVVDVNNNPNNPIIGIRSYGSDPELVARLGKASMEGIRDAGIIPCLKHFPGHGDVETDSHEALPIVSKTLEELEAVELYPFAQLANEAPSVMTAHILFTKVDPGHCATLSSILLQDVLRKKLNFEGVLITDSLTMQGVLQNHESIEQVAKLALLAGNDILLIGGRILDHPDEGRVHVDEVERIIRYFSDEVREGRISETRVDESVRRILKLKSGIQVSKGSLEQLRSKEHLDLADEIAGLSLWIKEGKRPELKEVAIAVIAPGSMMDDIQATDLVRLGNSFYSYDIENPASLNIQEDYVLFFAYNAWKYPAQLAFLRSIARTIPTACIAARDPYDLNLSQDSEVKIALFSPTRPSLQKVAEWFIQQRADRENFDFREYHKEAFPKLAE